MKNILRNYLLYLVELLTFIRNNHYTEIKNLLNMKYAVFFVFVFFLIRIHKHFNNSIEMTSIKIIISELFSNEINGQELEYW